MFNNLTTVTQGSVGLAYAIAAYTKLGFIVSVPLNDNQSYDLVVEQDGFLQRVQVKTTRQIKKDSKFYTVELKRTRSNKTANNCYNFDPDDAERLFILTEQGIQYDIPCVDITTTTSLTLTDKWDKYKLEGAAEVANRV